MTRRWLLLAAVASLPAGAAAGPADDEFFEKRVRPVLAEHCLSCHGETKQKGGLRLNSRAAVLQGGDLGPAVVPGQPDDSLLVKAIRLQDDLAMPPKGKLPDAVAAVLVEWVKRGAPWPGDAATAVRSDAPKAAAELWSLRPVVKPPVPTPQTAGWAQTDIDRFLLVKMEAAGLAPAPPADARTLARRLSFDLTGLPPTPERVAAFEKAVAADRPAAVRDYVAELLASPAYGEKWGRHWLDVARYSDSNGSEVDHAMANAWRYRDYVIRSFNQDKPFDRFVREQLAVDLLPDADPDDIAAAGFLMFGPKALAELDKEKLLWDIVDEQVDTAGRAFLGLTLGCARCHDHKFDPISAADYYAVAGVFRSTTTMDTSKRVATWVERPIDPADVAKRDALARKASKLKEERDDLSRAGRTGIPKLAAGDNVLVVEAEDFTKANVRVDWTQLGVGIGVVRTKEEYPDQIEYEFDLPASGEYQLELRYAAKEARPTHLLVNGNLEDMDAANAVTGDWGPKAQKWFVQGVYTFRAGRNNLTFRRDGPVPLFDKFLLGPPLSAGGRHSDKLKPPKATGFGDPETAKKLKALDAAIAAAAAEREKVPSVMVPADGPAADAPVLVRGNPATPGPVVPRGVPALGRDIVRPALAGSGRREFADWVASADNPLTARVIVNRVWLWHFGEGLVRSPDNFGVRGDLPTHPELLDYLATRFIDNGWSVKKLHALICNSAAYQQSSGTPPQADPENRLLTHWNRRRLDAEDLRDGMLAAAGALDRTAGGSLMDVLNRTYANGGSAPPDIAKRMHYDAPRRAVYLPVVRNAVYDLFAAFDYPEPGTPTGKRSATTVPQQALFLMNSPFVTSAAKKFAARVQKVAADDAGRVRAAYEWAVSRPPTPGEAAAADAFLDRDSDALTAIGDPDPRGAAWVRFCHALLSSNGFLYLR